MANEIVSPATVKMIRNIKDGEIVVGKASEAEKVANSLTIINGDTTVTYDGSEAQSITIESTSSGSDTSETYEETLSTTGWVDNSQTITISGITSDYYVKVVPAEGYSAAYVNYGIEPTEVIENGVVFSCETMPTEDIVVKIVVSSLSLSGDFGSSSGGSSSSNTTTTSTIMTLDDMTWDQISEISQAGKAPSIFHIGQEKKISLSTGEEVTTVILGFNHDDLSDGSGKAGITFGLKNCLKTVYTMNSSFTNEGGWESSEMRERMSTFKYYLPSDLQSVICTVNKNTSEGSASSTIDTTEDELFLFSHIEVFGTYYYSTTSQRSYLGEGIQYEYYMGKTWCGSEKYTIDTFGTEVTYSSYAYYQENAFKGLGDDATSAAIWWLRSPCYESSTSFCCINAQSSAGINDDNYTYGVCFGFCV